MAVWVHKQQKPPKDDFFIAFPTRFKLMSAEPDTIDIPPTKTSIK